MVGTPTYRAWLAIQDRCKGVAKETYARNYRDRGITVCEGWSGPGGFERFLADMGERPHPKLTIERVDNDKGYSPDNCRWATRAEQSRNTRQNVWITMPDGERVVLEDACDVAGIKSCTVSGTASRTGGTRQDMFDFYAGAPSASYGFQLVLYAQAWLASRPWPRGFMALL
jgi:hypothetical protein